MNVKIKVENIKERPPKANIGIMKFIKVSLIGWGACMFCLSVHSQTQLKDIAIKGDRNPNLNQRFPEHAFYHNGEGGEILDVTKPPFNAKGDGITDDTVALSSAMRFVREHYEIAASQNDVSCSERKNHNWIIYLPTGTYLVSNTISQGWPALAMNIRNGWKNINYLKVNSPEHEKALYEQMAGKIPYLHNNPQCFAVDDNNGSYMRGQYGDAMVYGEVNWGLRIIGENRKNTIIKLKDNTRGFENEKAKPVVLFYLLERGSNVNIGNFFENITIDTGRNNPGAVGLRWNSSNLGGVRNVAITSGDGTGETGLSMECNNATGYFRDLLISGFDTGMRLSAGRETMVVLEHSTFSGQKKVAIYVGNAGSGAGGDSFSARKLLIRDTPLALHCGRAGQVVLMQSQITAENGICAEIDASLIVRNVLFNGNALPEQRSTVELPVEEQPVVNPEIDLSRWACVDDFGAVGDGKTDDTVAIQRAMDSGRPVITFTKPNYVVDGQVNIPAGVKEIDGTFANIIRRKSAAFDAPALLTVAENSETPLLVHRILSAGGVLVDHAAVRSLVMEDIYVMFNHIHHMASIDGYLFPYGADEKTEIWRGYRNSTPEVRKKVFITNCISSTGDKPDGSLAIQNVDFFGRMVNSEHVSGALYSFFNSTVWILGFKSENSETVFAARKNTRMEILGGSFLLWSKLKGPVIYAEDSDISTFFYLWHWRIVSPIILRKTKSGETGEILAKEFMPLTSEDACVIRIK